MRPSCGCVVRARNHARPPARAATSAQSGSHHTTPCRFCALGILSPRRGANPDVPGMATHTRAASACLCLARWSALCVSGAVRPAASRDLSGRARRGQREPACLTRPSSPRAVSRGARPRAAGHGLRGRDRAGAGAGAGRRGSPAGPGPPCAQP
jgi:hypothetical protein